MTESRRDSFAEIARAGYAVTISTQVGSAGLEFVAVATTPSGPAVLEVDWTARRAVSRLADVLLGRKPRKREASPVRAPRRRRRGPLPGQKELA